MADPKSTPIDGFSTPLKEVEPPRTTEIEKAQEVIEYEPAAEVSPHVEVRKEQIEIPADLEEMGVTADETTKFPTHQDIKLPLSDEKIEKGLHQPVTSSFRWLAELCVYILKKAHLGLKNIHGKITRVANR